MIFCKHLWTATDEGVHQVFGWITVWVPVFRCSKCNKAKIQKIK